MFLRIDKVIVNQDYISHCIVDDNEELISVSLKSGLTWIFADQAQTYSKEGRKTNYTYITSEQWNSLKCFLRGDFSRNVA